MAVGETAKLIVDLSLKGNFAKQLQTSGRALGKFDAKLDHTESRAYRAGQQIGTGIKRAAAIGAAGIGLLGYEVVQGLDSLVELEKQTAQTNAAIKSTKGVAGVTAAEVRKLAESFEAMNATVGDEVIQSAENLLLSFTNIRKKAFEPALQAILDINTRLGRGPDGLAGTARLVGKALNDPLKGLSALTRVGITFDAKTTARIKKLAKEGKLYQAQGVILGELQKRFKGAFAAEGGTTAGKVAKFKDSIEDLQRTLAAGLLPVVSNIADALTDLFADPAVQAGVKEFGQNLAKVLSPENIKAGIGTVKDVLSTIAAVAGPAASAIGAIVTAFSKMPDWAQKVLIGGFALNKLTGGLVTNVAGGLIGALKNLVVPLMNVEAGNVNVVGAGGIPGAGAGGAGAAGKGAGALGSIVKLAAGAVVVGAVAEIADAIHEQIKPPSTATTDLSWPWGPKNTPTIAPGFLSELFGKNGILGGTPAGAGGKGGTADHFGAADQQKKLAAIQLEVQRKGEQTAGKVDDTKKAVDATKTKVGTTGQAIQNTTRQSSLSNAAIVSGAIAVQTGAIVGAIYAARPVVNVTNVTKSTTIQNRYGSGTGSQGSDSHAGGVFP